MPELKNEVAEPTPVVEECQCGNCGFLVVYRVYFIGERLYGRCVMCGAEYDLASAIAGRGEELALRAVPPPPPPPPPKVVEKKGLFGRKLKTPA